MQIIFFYFYKIFEFQTIRTGWHADGTFKTSLDFFKQLYTMMNIANKIAYLLSINKQNNCTSQAVGTQTGRLK